MSEADTNVYCRFRPSADCSSHDNAVAESFFQLLKRERIKKKIYVSRTEARSDNFEYIEMFYNSKRRHGSNGQRSPLDYEKAHQKMVMCV